MQLRTGLQCGCVALLMSCIAQSVQAATPQLVAAHDVATLREELLDIVAAQLAPRGLFVERQGAWLGISGESPAGEMVAEKWAGEWELRAGTALEGQVPTLPLTFELRPHAATSAGPPVRPLQATLAVTLLRDVWTAARRLRKGSRASCADLTLQRRRVQMVPARALPLECDIDAGAVALRDLASGDAVRSNDIGKAPDVSAGAAVLVNVAAGGISIATTAVALADGCVGDRLEVRLQRPTRILRTRVIAPGTVQLLEASL